MMDCSTAIALAIQALEVEGLYPSIEAVRKRSTEFRGKAVSVRSLMRTENYKMLQTARARVGGQGAGSSPVSKKKMTGSVAALARANEKIARLMLENRALSALHRERRGSPRP